MSQRQKILLLQDVDNLGRSGDVVTAKAGFVRNFLLPQKLAVMADKHTLMIQERLQKERALKAATDKKEAEEIAKRIEGMMLITEVKVDPEGHMYGSVAAADIVHLFEKEGYSLEKKNVVLKHPVKEIGEHALELKLKEGVKASYFLKVIPEGFVPQEKAEEKEPVSEKSEETQEEETSS